MEEQIVITPENDEQSVAIDRENISVGGGAVNSVNGQTGDVVLTTSDLENTSDYQTGGEVESAISSAIGQINVPTKTSELVNDGSDGTSTYVEADGLATVATSGSYSDLDNKPTIPTVNDATLTITQNGTSKGTFTANDSDDTTIEVSDTTYSNFVGTDGNTGGTAGLVPAPQTTDTDKFLKSDGTWATTGGGGGTKFLTSTDYNYPIDNPTAVNPGMMAPGVYFVKDDTVKVFNGESSQNARTEMVFIVSQTANSNDTIHEMMVIYGGNGASSSNYKISFYYVNVATGTTSKRGGTSGYGLLDGGYIVDNLTTNNSKRALSAGMGRSLNQKITPTTGSSTPTSSTAGTVGKVYIDTTTETAYMCVASSSGSQTWKQITT